jgi:ubiquinone/menaquinone biosynthesis C-methylase UbiE
LSADRRDLAKFFERRASSYDEADWVSSSDNLTLFRKLCLASYRQDRILDLATGTGLIGSLFKEEAEMVVGVDISMAMLQEARSRLSYLILADLEQLPLCSESFGLVTCRQGLHYVNLEATIGEIARLCEPGGAVIIGQITPYGDVDLEWFRSLASLKKPYLASVVTQVCLIDALRADAFECIRVLETTGVDSLDSWSGRNDLPKTVRKEAWELFTRASEEISALYGFSYADRDVHFQMHWTLVKAVKPKTVLGSAR